MKRRKIQNEATESGNLLEGEAAITRAGKDVTIVSLGMMVHHAMRAARQLAEEGIDAEVIDLRTLVPLDRDAINRSVKKTGHLIVVDEDYSRFGLSAEVIASVVEYDIRALKSEPQRVAYPDIPIQYSRPMEQFALPSADKIISAVHHVMGPASPAVGMIP